MDLGSKAKRVLVGGGSRGIGRAIVELFLEEGAQVSFCARSAHGVSTAEQAMSGQARGSVVDVQDASQIAQWAADSAKFMGGIDIVIPDVSALAGGGTIESWRQAFEVDILGSVNLVNASLSYLEASDAPSVVLISSVSGREIDRFAEPYGLLKAALTHYGKTLSAQHAKSGIRVNTVAPGNVYFPDGAWGDIERNDPTGFAQCLAANPFGRMARPDEVASATVFLASP